MSGWVRTFIVEPKDVGASQEPTSKLQSALIQTVAGPGQCPKWWFDANRAS